MIWVAAVYALYELRRQPVTTTMHLLVAGGLLVAAVAAAFGLLLGGRKHAASAACGSAGRCCGRMGSLGGLSLTKRDGGRSQAPTNKFAARNRKNPPDMIVFSTMTRRCCLITFSCWNLFACAVVTISRSA